MNDITPKISIVICAYNEEKYIAGCIESVKKQEVDVPFETIVVNNASTDDTEKVAKDAGAHVVTEEKKSVGYARQKGLDTARGEILVYLDADVRIPKGWLQKVYNYLLSHPDVAAICCDFRFYDATWWQNAAQRFFELTLMRLNNFIMGILKKPEAFIGQSAALRTAWLRRAGGVNLDFAFHGEDTSLAYRMYSQGKVKFVYDFYALSSARRYHRDGFFKTLFDYWVTYWYLTMGNYKKAVKFAEEHNPK